MRRGLQRVHRRTLHLRQHILTKQCRRPHWPVQQKDYLFKLLPKIERFLTSSPQPTQIIGITSSLPLWGEEVPLHRDNFKNSSDIFYHSTPITLLNFKVGYHELSMLLFFWILHDSNLTFLYNNNENGLHLIYIPLVFLYSFSVLNFFYEKNTWLSQHHWSLGYSFWGIVSIRFQ